MKTRSALRWLPVTLVGLTLCAAFGSQANAQGKKGDIVQIDWGGQRTKARIEHCASDSCDLYLWDAAAARWSDGTLWKSKSEIRGLKGQVNEGAAAPPVERTPSSHQSAKPSAMYKVGDKIESQVTGRWQPGTIVSVQRGGDGQLNFLVNHDGEASTWDRWASAAQIRARTGLISETAKAHNELAALGALKAPKAGSLDQTFQDLIRQRYESQGNKGFPVTVVFQGFAVGRTHPYAQPDVHSESADGPGGRPNTLVYPVSAQYTHRHSFRDAFLSYQSDERYSCFKNSFEKWECNAASGGRGTIRQFREERDR